MNHSGSGAGPESRDEKRGELKDEPDLRGHTPDVYPAVREDHFRQIVDLSPDLMALVSRGKYLYVNPAGEKILRASAPGELHGASVLKFIHADHVEMFRASLEQAEQGVAIPPAEETLICRDGTRLDVEVREIPLLNEPEPLVLMIAREITARKEAEAAGREREERYRTLLETMEEGYYEVDLSGNYTFVNDSLCRIHGIPREKILGVNNREIMDHATAQKIYKIFHHIYETGQPARLFEWEIIKKDGSRNVEESSVYLIRDAQGKPIGFRGIVRDITERKKLEETLREREERFRQVAENAGAWIWEVDTEGRYTYSSPVVERMLGYRPEEIVGKKYYYDLLAPKAKEELQEKVLAIFQRREAIRRLVNLNVHKNGRLVYLETTAAPILDGNGNLRGYRGVDKDITERKQTQELYETLTNSSQVGIYIMQDRKFRFMNPRFRSYFGDSAREPGNIDPLSVVHPEDREKVRQNAANILKQGLKSSHEFRIIDANGKVRWLLERITSISYEGKPAVLANNVDITELKDVEGALRRSEQAAQRFAEQHAIVAQIGRMITSSLNMEEVFEGFAQEVRKLIPFDRVIVNLNNFGEGTVTTAYVSGDHIERRMPKEAFPLKGSLNEEMMRTRSGFIFHPDSPGELQGRFPLPDIFPLELRSMLSAPLISRGVVIGGLHFLSKTVRTYTDPDLLTASLVADQIAGAIANVQLYHERNRAAAGLRKSEEESKRLAREAAVLAEIGRIINSTLRIEEVYEHFAEKVSQLLPLERISIHVFYPEEGLVRIVYVSGTPVRDRRVGDSYALGPLTQDMIRNRKSLLIQTDDPAEVSRHSPQLLSTFHAGLHSMLSAPLISNDQVIGMMHVRSKKREAYTDNDVRLAERVGNQIAGAIANARLFAGRQQAEKALRESEEKYRAVVQNANDAIFVAQDGVIKFSNAKTEELTGYSAAELAEIPFVRQIHPEDREAVTERCKDHSSGKPPGIFSFRIRNKSGEDFWVELNSVGIVWEERPATLNFLRNITEQKTLESQFLQSQKMEAVGRLAGGIAHDFNNLLTIVNTHAQIGLSEIKEWDPLRDKFEAIQKAGERAANLTRQLLAFSRRQSAEMKVIDLNSILQDLEKMLERVLGEDMELLTVLDKDLGWVKADPVQIEQILLNLVVNARDAMPSGGKLTVETGNVEVTEEYAYTHLGMKAGNYIMLSVSDTGVGMTPATRERIFEPFFTTKEVGKGTGLGLSTVYGIVQQSKGHIWVYSEPGKGTTLKIYLPRVDEPVQELDSKPAKKNPAGGSETILVAEDEEEVRKLAVQILRKHGYHVLEASHGGDALLICEQWKESIHLLLTDVVMPDVHGPDLARRLKSFHPNIKVLFMSGYTDNAILQNGVLDRNMSFLQKPFSIQTLARMVRDVLDN